ncbi:hypothetical protein CB0940_00838 [Cercospora beticola]|uniref:Aflatoxin regulatory protein domain-containing protein n=1 Tax=Cercospora beticola TaxID=122368 RepID=A0A2G5IC23_CERBT|nr:hypothetical protein CB0940_00838 [Cercospora beticola]PIB02406.1 hypothetical protein CB0940_00838 [Cercospora beticola]WPA96265.1 hypothetical protein RHO25_000871 [Cercospora beticola]
MRPSAQKIRCGKERPSCARCFSKDICCNYSPSLRTGRHPGSVVDQQSYNLHGNVDLPASERNELDVSSPNGQSCSNGHDISDFLQDNWPWDKPLGGLADATAPVHSHFSSSRDWATMDWTKAPSTRVTPLDWSPPHTLPPGMEHNNCPQHDCYATLLRLAAEQLHVPSQKCLNAASGVQADARCARDVDSLLTENREAIRLLDRSLSCACMSDMSVKLVAYMVANKIVSMYGAIVGEPDCGDIVDSPIFIGSYALDTAARRSVRARTVLNEIRQQVEPVVARLPRFQPVIPSERGGPQEQTCVVKTDEAVPIECMLRTELQRVVAIANSMIY